MQPFVGLTSRVIPVPTENVDTDRIVPARFLTMTGRKGLDRALFADWRSSADGTPNSDCPLDLEAHEGARILLAGDNFGCGSSREHAAWALLDSGIRVVLSTRFADIFRGNALRNGLLAVELERAVHQRLLRQVQSDPTLEVAVMLEDQAIRLPDGDVVAFEIDGFSKHCLLRGLDQLGFLTEQLPAIEAWEAERPPKVDTRSPAPSGRF